MPFTWIIDLEAPAITFTGVPPNPSDNASASFVFFATEPSTFTCRLDAEVPGNCDPDPTDPTKGSQSYTGLREGLHIFTVTATDKAGNVSPALVFAWRIDLTAPTLTITSAPFNPTNANTARFAFTASEPSTFHCQLSGPLVQDSDCGAVPSTGGTATYTGLGEGTYTFTVTAKDTAGNPSSRSFTFVIDQTPPAITISASPATAWPPNGKMVPVTITGTMTDPTSGVNMSTVAYAVTDEYGLVQPSGNVTLAIARTDRKLLLHDST